MKAALGGFAPLQWGGLVSGDCIIPASASTERIGRVIDLKKITTISEKAWCQKILDQLDNVDEELFFENVIDRMILADETDVNEPMSVYEPQEAQVDAAIAGSEKSMPLETFVGSQWGYDQWIGVLLRFQSSLGPNALMNKGDAISMVNMATELRRQHSGGKCT